MTPEILSNETLAGVQIHCIVALAFASIVFAGFFAIVKNLRKQGRI